SVAIDASNLEPGDYLLPTYDYPFVRVTDATGAAVPTTHFDRRPVIRHTGASVSYAQRYDFTPEILAIVAGLALLMASTFAVLLWPLRHRLPILAGAAQKTGHVPPIQPQVEGQASGL